MRLLVNGNERDFPELSEGASVQELVAKLGFRPDRVAIERNGEIVPRSTWPATSLASGDKLEIVHFVGGGIPF